MKPPFGGERRLSCQIDLPANSRAALWIRSKQILGSIRARAGLQFRILIVRHSTIGWAVRSAWVRFVSSTVLQSIKACHIVH
jgi:hypothetical protein